MRKDDSNSQVHRALEVLGLSSGNGAARWSVPRGAAVTAPPNIGGDGRARLVLGVTTFNRREYLQRFVESFMATRSRDYHWTLVIADDGSADSTYDYIDSLQIEDCQVIAIRNKRAMVTGQTNSIFRAAEASLFDFGFKADDDIYFKAPGWDHLYVEAARATGRHHLVFHDASWTAPQHDIVQGPLHSSVPADATMGCFWTFTPEVLERIGVFDEPEFRLRGHAHWDFTFRACRAGFNDFETAWDAAGSEELLGMWGRDDYVTTIDWGSSEVKAVLTNEERARRNTLIRDPERRFVDPATAQLGGRPPAVLLTPFDRALSMRCRAAGMLTLPGSMSGTIDRAYVLNLVGDLDKWTTQAAQLSAAGITVERFGGVDGSLPEIQEAWRRYSSRGLELELERRIGRRLIASPGAWAYLLGIRKILETAMRDRLDSVLIFDDDVALHRAAPEILRDAMAELPASWKIAYLGATQRDWSTVEKYSTHLYRPRGAVDGSYAVAVRSPLFKEMIEAIDRFDAPFDSGALSEAAMRNPDDTFVVWPNVAIADVRSSSLRAARDQVDFATKARWRLGDYARDFSSAVAPPRRGELDPARMISVIVPVDTASWWSWHGLRSLVGQSHRSFEVLLVPDVSVPHLVEHAHALAATDSRISVLEVDRPLGTTHRLNVGLDAAHGRLVSFQSLAEISAPTRLERLFELSEEASLPVRARLTRGISASRAVKERAGVRGQIVSLDSGVVPMGLLKQVGGIASVEDGAAVDAVLRHQRMTRGYLEGVGGTPCVPWAVGSLPVDRRLEVPAQHAPEDLGAATARWENPVVPIHQSTLRTSEQPAYRVFRSQ